LLAKTEVFKRMRAWFMPGLVSVLETSDNTDGLIELVLLHLPSSLNSAKCARICVVGLAAAELALRHVAMADALKELLCNLCTRSYFNRFKIKNITGVVTRTRAHHSLQGLCWRITAVANTYRRQHATCLALLKPGDDAWTKVFKPVLARDVCGYNEQAYNKQEVADCRQLVELTKVLRKRAADTATAAAAANTNVDMDDTSTTASAAAAAAAAAVTANAVTNVDEDDEGEEDLEEPHVVYVDNAQPGTGSMLQLWIWLCSIGLLNLDNPSWLDSEHCDASIEPVLIVLSAARGMVKAALKVRPGN
jgi:hypothetical protein